MKRWRLIVTILALLSLAFAWHNMTRLSRTSAWYRNADANMGSIVHALALNSGLPPTHIDTSAFLPTYLQALDFRIRNWLGLPGVWNLAELRSSPDPLPEIRALVHQARNHQRLLVILAILAAACLNYVIIPRWEVAGLTITLMCSSSGLLFHGLLIQPELLCATFGGILALLCIWRGTNPAKPGYRERWLFVAGIAVGLATLCAVSGLYYLGLCCLWCVLAGFVSVGAHEPTAGSPQGKSFTLAAPLSAIVMLGLVHIVELLGLSPDLIALQRLRVFSLAVGSLPLLSYWVQHRGGVMKFLAERAREFSLLGGGFLVAIGLAYAMLRALAPSDQAMPYWVGLLNSAFDLGPHIRVFETARPDLGRELLLYLKEAPFLVLSTVFASLIIISLQRVPLRFKFWIALLLLNATGFTLLLGQGHFSARYSLFLQLPLLLAWPLMYALLTRTTANPEPNDVTQWSRPLILTALPVLVLTVGLRLSPKYNADQPNPALPVSDLTLTYLFDYDSYPSAYRNLMKTSYGTRKEFAETLNSFLSDPAQRN